MKFDVVAIGSTTRDAFFNTNFKIVKYPNTPTGKAYIVPMGEKMGIDEVYFTLGGNAANASVTFARQGYKTAILTKVGEDVSGEEIRRYLKKDGVYTDFITTSKLNTAYSVLMLQGGERTILSYHGAIDEFSLKGINLDKLKSRWWYVSLPGESYRLFGKIIAAARRNNVSVALNPSFKHLIEGKRELIRNLKYVSFLVVNEGEAAELTGISFKREKQVFKKIDDLMPGIVAVTSGPRGVTVSDGKYIYKAGIFKNKKIIDRTGAGDSFGSGFVSGLMRKKENIEHAIRLASANSTSVVERLGATEGILTKSDFEKSPRFKRFKITKEKIT